MNNSAPPRSTIERVNAIARKGRHAEALSAAEAGLRHHPADVDLRMQRARLRRLLGRLDDSRAELEAVVAAHPDRLDAAYELAQTLRAAGAAAEALEVAERILARMPDHPGALVIRGGILAHELQNPAAALCAAETGLRHHPANVGLRMQHGRFRRMLGQLDDSRAELEAVVAAHPDRVDAAYELAQTLRAAGAAAEALEVAERILARMPDHLGALVIRDGILAHELQNPAAALCAAETGLRHHPANVGLRMQRARFWRMLGRLDDSRTELEAVVAAHPDRVDAAYELAQTLRAAGAAAEALEVAERILARMPTHPEALLMQADILAELAAHEKLVALLGTYLDALPRTSRDSDRTALAAVACKIMLGLPIQVSAPLLERHHALLCGSADAVPPRFLWSTYRLADSIGLGANYTAFVDALSHSPRLQLPECRQIMMDMFYADAPDSENLSRSLIQYLPEVDRKNFELELVSLFSGAGAALKKRKAVLGKERRLSVTRLIARFLREAGRQPVALRYLGWVARARPGDDDIFSDHVIALIVCGEGDMARDLLERRRLAAERLSPKMAAILVRAYIQLGDHETALRLCETLDPHGRRSRLGVLYVHMLFAAGRNADALAEMELLKNSGGNRFVHFGPSILGVTHLEASLDAGASDLGDVTADSLSAARGVIREWRRRNSTRDRILDDGAIPRRIMQYWDKRVPPPEIAEAVERWRNAPGFSHTLFNRGSAERFLAERLGKDWHRALRMAGSATEESDFFRLCHLMVEGGIYVDCDDWLVGDLNALFRRAAGLTVFLEPLGTIANNVIIARPMHPAVIWAAVSARRALLERHNESTWARLGPGLITRAVARYIGRDLPGQQGAEDVTLIDQWRLGPYIQIHSPLPYKKSRKYWNKQNDIGGLNHLFTALASRMAAQ